MVIRISFTTDTEMMELVDKYAKENGIDRNRAILELIESGFTKATGTTPSNLNQKRAFEEYNDLRLSLEAMKQSLKELTEEVKLIHHIIDVELVREMKPVPFQSKKWWEFWKSP
ncbi:MAG: type II secretion system protein E [Methanoregulaceae archaeon]|jgi:chromosomal replication initiation ATPase DnaA|nr:type II secretion system protein E [Methanoregulaceae archaeon]